MDSARQAITLALICLVVLVFSVAGIAAAFVTHIELNIDGILLILIGLLMAAIFGFMLLMMVRERSAKSKQEGGPAPDTKKPEASQGS
jgi:cytochrome c biogenesis protein CcdA